jgi:CHAT domain-containing protein
VDTSLLNSLSVLRTSTQARTGLTTNKTQSGLDVFAIGNPAFDGQLTPAPLRSGDAQQTSWKPLAASLAEMQAVLANFPAARVRLVTGQDASESGLRALSDSGDLAKAKFVLISTHAWYAASRPARSHIVLLKRGEAPQEDGELTSSELAGLKMNSELTVVAACSSSRSETGASDGQFGFAYALTLAGNRNAVLTLWPVRDEEAAQFVARLFTHLARGVTHARALATTKREFMNHPDARLRNSRVWAAFVLFGV